jgi:hypothetical protein
MRPHLTSLFPGYDRMAARTCEERTSTVPAPAPAGDNGHVQQCRHIGYPTFTSEKP